MYNEAINMHAIDIIYNTVFSLASNTFSLYSRDFSTLTVDRVKTGPLPYVPTR
jgi:hypothetical protein